MPLGDPHAGVCNAALDCVPDERLRTCCNTGYARGACPSFPGGDAPDAIRFAIIDRQAGFATIRYVIERDHHPFDHGTLSLRENDEPETGAVNVVERQARAFLLSYLRRAS